MVRHSRSTYCCPEFPPLGPDLKPRTITHTAEETAAHQKAYAEMVRGQVEELLTQYGRIDVLWFDGKPNVPHPESIVTAERIRELQPGIVVNPRLHGHGDYLLGIGPMPSGELEPEAYGNMAVVADWMKVNGAAIKSAKPLPNGETASVPATAAGSTRYLFAVATFHGSSAYEKDMIPAADETLTLSGIARPEAVRLLRDGSMAKSTFADGVLTVQLPAASRTKLVDVVEVQLKALP